MNHFFNFFGRLCVVSVLIVAPWTGGGSEPIIFQYLGWGVFASALLALCSLWTTPKRERQKNVYWGTIATSVVLTLGLALCCWQIVPLSDAALARFSPYIFDLKSWLLPQDAPELTIADVSRPDFQAPELASEEELQKTQVFLGSAFAFEEGTDFDLQTAQAVDAAIENELLPVDSASRDAWGKTISVYPLATREELTTLWAAAILFLATAILFNTNSSRRFLWKSVVFNGLAFALFCIATRANPAIVRSETFVRLFGEYSVNASFGTYINKNAAGGYLVLVWSALLALFALEFLKSTFKLCNEEIIAREQATRDGLRHSRRFSWRNFLGDAVDLFNRRLLFWVISSGFLFASILISLSRGASGAACVAGVAAFTSLGFRKQARAYWPALAAPVVVALGGLLWTGLNEKVDDRMSTLVEETKEGEGTAIERDGRWENWSAAVKTSQNYRVFGSGLGTYSLASRVGDVLMKNNRLCFHAENIFVEALLETGVLGLGLLLAFYVVVIGIIVSLLRGGRGLETTAVATGGLALVLGQAISSSGDFGIYLPANLFLAASLCGTLVGRQNVRYWEKLNAGLKNVKTAQKTAKKAAVAGRVEIVGASVSTAFLVAGLAGVPWFYSETSDYIERTNLLREARIEPKEAMYASSESVESTANDLRKYLERRDDCYEMRVALSDLAVARFKAKYWEAKDDGDSQIVDENEWKVASFEFYAETILNYHRFDFYTAAGAIQDNPALKETATQGMTDLLAARRICPLDESLYERIAIVIPVAVKTRYERERQAIELAARRCASVSPFDSRAIFQCGFILRAAKIDPLWIRFWRRSAEYSSVYLPPVLNILTAAAKNARIDELTEQILPDDVKTINSAIKNFASQKDSPIFNAVKKKGLRVYAEIPDDCDDGEQFRLRAEFRQSIGLIAEADEDYRRAIELAPDRWSYLYDRAVFLITNRNTLGQEEEAIRLLEDYSKTPSARFNPYWKTKMEVASRNLAMRQARENVAARNEEKKKNAKTAKKSETTDEETSTKQK